MATTIRLRVAAFGTLIGIVGLTVGFVGVNSALDKAGGCVSPTYVSVAYGICR